ncbi:MAG: hypothetical protein WCI17_09150 [bacterium]
MNKLMRMGLWLGMLALLGGLAPYAVAGTTYTWTNNNPVGTVTLYGLGAPGGTAVFVW